MKFEIMLGIVFSLLARGKITAGEIAAKYEISRRSVYRYIEVISMCVPIYVIHGPGGGYFIEDNFRLPATFLSEGEYNVVLQALNALSEDFPGGEINSAIEKITAVARFSSQIDLNSSSLMIDSGPWGITANYNNKLRVLEECVASSYAVKIFYRNSGGEASERVIEPHTLVLKQGIWYVYAFCRLKGAFRTFKVGRIEREIVLGEKFERKNTEGLKEALSYFGAGDSMEVCLDIAEEAASEIEEWLGVECVKREESGITASALLPLNGGLVSKILGYGGKVKVISPKILKERVKAAAEEVVAAYAAE